jgi:hypothetical protein
MPSARQAIYDAKERDRTRPANPCAVAMCEDALTAKVLLPGSELRRSSAFQASPNEYGEPNMVAACRADAYCFRLSQPPPNGRPATLAVYSPAHRQSTAFQLEAKGSFQEPE